MLNGRSAQHMGRASCSSPCLTAFYISAYMINNIWGKSKQILQISLFLFALPETGFLRSAELPAPGRCVPRPPCGGGEKVHGKFLPPAFPLPYSVIRRYGRPPDYIMSTWRRRYGTESEKEAPSRPVGDRGHPDPSVLRLRIADQCDLQGIGGMKP